MGKLVKLEMGFPKPWLELQVSGLWRRRYAPHGWQEATLALLTAFLRAAAIGEVTGVHVNHIMPYS
jgi:hypothetical protein